MSTENQVSATMVMAVHRAARLGILEARKFVQEANPELVKRILRAYAEQVETSPSAGYVELHDPLEDDPQHAEAFKYAEEEAIRQTEPEWEQERQHIREKYADKPDAADFFFRRARRAVYSRQEHIKKQILKEKFGLDWWTYREMNPGSKFC